MAECGWEAPPGATGAPWSDRRPLERPAHHKSVAKPASALHCSAGTSKTAPLPTPPRDFCVASTGHGHRTHGAYASSRGASANATRSCVAPTVALRKTQPAVRSVLVSVRSMLVHGGETLLPHRWRSRSPRCCSSRLDA